MAWIGAGLPDLLNLHRPVPRRVEAGGPAGASIGVAFNT
jgi:hypothetical protein